MRRPIVMLLGIVSVALALVVVPVPASATDLCVGHGLGNTGPLYYPVTVDPTVPQVTVRQPSTVGFGFNFTPVLGTCVSSDGTLAKWLTAGGTLTGWCGHFSGEGMANDGARFAWIGAGSLFVLTGHVVGVLNVSYELVDRCSSGATQFLVTGAVVLLHCALSAPGLIITPVPSTSALPIPFVHVHTGPMNYHSSLCVPGAL